MKIELGKTYRTCDGRKALVIYVGANNPYSVAVVIRRDQYETIEKYTENGKFDLDRDGYNDLVAEWVEPEAPKQPRKLYAFRSVTLTIYYCETENCYNAIHRVPQYDLEFK